MLAEKYIEEGGDAKNIIDKNNLGYVAQLLRDLMFNRNDIRYLEYLKKSLPVFFEKYEEKFSKVYEQLIRLPFSVIVNTTPDSFLENMFKKRGIHSAHKFWYFNYTAPQYNKTSARAKSKFNVFTKQNLFVTFTKVVHSI